MYQLTILTGGSRGMGRAIAEQLLAPHAIVLCMSRHANAELQDLATQRQARLEQWCVDLSDANTAVQQLTSWLLGWDTCTLGSATLINNAGVIPPLVPMDQSQASDLAVALRVGLEAPMQLTAAFLNATAAWTLPRKVLNISSGLGRRPMASSAAYCAAKAGMDHFTRCLALEETFKPNGAKVCSLAPGVIDTDMQVQLRSADSSAFPDQGAFADLHRNGQLTTAALAAERVLTYLRRPDFGTQPVADVRA